MLEIDGSLRSGSGTIARDAVPFAILRGEALRLSRIRAKRSQTGLRPQHLKALEACARLCDGRLEGGRVGASEITFHPGGAIRGGEFSWNIGTAGSTTMLAMTLLPLALFAGEPSVHTITGGLFQDFAPSAFHFREVLLPALQAMGADARLEILQPGYVPKGQGRIRLQVAPARGGLRPLERSAAGRVEEVRGIALASRLANRRVAERMARECRQALAGGESCFRIPRMTDHVESRLWLVEEILGAKTELDGTLVRIRGIGYGGGSGAENPRRSAAGEALRAAEEIRRQVEFP
jgi:RNA 3'-terminal phosphate cyclase (ATP)